MNCFDIGASMEELLWEGLEMAAAWDRVHDRESGEYTSEEYYNLMIAAGYSEEIAQKAGSDRAEARLLAGVKP